MTWEEYESSDWYREAHPERFERKSKEDKIAEEMRQYLACIDEYNERVEEQKEKYIDEDKDYPECLDKGITVEDCPPEGVVTYITTKIFNGRVRGILRQGTYKECLLARYNYNVSCINSEWDWAGVKRITAQDADELDDILIGYRECEYDDYYEDDY